MTGSPCFLASIRFLLSFQFFDDLVQLAEPRVPELVIPLDPRRHFFQSARADPAGAYAADFFRGDEPRLLEEANVLLHAREGHVELHGQVRDRRFRATQLLEDAPTGDVRQRGERGIEVGIRILNHTVQYLTTDFRGMQGRAISSARSRGRGPPAMTPARVPRARKLEGSRSKRTRPEPFCWGWPDVAPHGRGTGNWAAQTRLGPRRRA